jgi:hypothetical protein
MAPHDLVGMDRAPRGRAPDDGCTANSLAARPTCQQTIGPANGLLQSIRPDAQSVSSGRDVAIAAWRRPIALALFALWFGVVCVAAWNHAIWRDEMRALPLALQGDNVLAMLKGIHGEGHPAVWYLLLRGAHALVNQPQVLPIVSLTVASVAMLLLVSRSPFDLPMIALLLASPFAVSEFSVMARNYGISMLILFLLAVSYERHRNRGVLLGMLLLLLANCNAHSVILVLAFLLFWLVDTVVDGGVRRSPALRTFLLNAVVAALGIAICLFTILPTFNDAAMLDRPDGITFDLLLRSLLLPADAFTSLVPHLHDPTADQPSLLGISYVDIMSFPMSLIVFGSTLGLIRRPGALLGAVAALIGFSLFFNVIYHGAYRHQALWLVFLVAMYWIAGARSTPREPGATARPTSPLAGVSAIGSILFLLLVALQAPAGIFTAAEELGRGPPLSRSRDLAALIMQRPDLRDAVIIADPDYLVEPLPYYLANRTYLMREQRFGNVVIFTRKARLRLSLDDILTDASNIRHDTGKPVIVLLQQRLNASEPARVYREGYDWELITTPNQVRAFQASTRLIARFAPARDDESFDVYVLDNSDAGECRGCDVAASARSRPG